MRRLGLALLVLCALRCASAARPAARNDLGTRVDAVFAELVKPGAPGCAVAIARDGATVLERGYGLANLEHDVPITPATVFESGSVAKQFVAAAIVSLALEGKLGLDDRARKYLPELDASADAVTIRQMLSHTSGLCDFGPIIGVEGYPRGTRVFTHEDVLEVMSRQRELNFEPGTQYTYNTGAYNLLAVIVERVAGESLEALQQRRIFAPLGMTSTTWRDDSRRVVKRRASSYSRRGDTFRNEVDAESIFGNCCLFTTVGDLLRWDAAAAGDPLRKQMEIAATLADGRKVGYGLGLDVDDTPGKRSVSHTGATAGYRALLTRNLDDGVSIALLCNRGDGLSIMGRLLAAVADRPPPPARTPASASQGAALIGMWRDPRTDALIVIESANDQLRLKSGGPVTLLPNGSFAVGDSELRLDSDGLHLLSKVKPEALYVRVEPVKPDPSALTEYAGTYISDEARARWNITVEKGSLVARPRVSMTIPLTPTYADGFVTPDGDLLRFTRDAAGKVNGFDVKTQVSMSTGNARLERIHLEKEPTERRRPGV